MKLSEFISSGDLKFIIVFIFFLLMSLFHFFKKIKILKSSKNKALVSYHNSKINIAAFWILIVSILSLSLGLLHGFYTIGASAGVSPNIIFQGISYVLITPVSGIVLYMICKILGQISNKTNTTISHE